VHHDCFFEERASLTFNFDLGGGAMSSQNLHNTLLRPAILQVLRAAGFSNMKPSVLDTVTDIAARYLQLLASRTAEHAFNNHNDYIPEIRDVRLALQDVGALRPQLNAMEQDFRGKEDLRAVNAFIEWAQGPVNKEIRRIAGLGGGETEAVNVDGEANEDYLTGLPLSRPSFCRANSNQL